MLTFIKRNDNINKRNPLCLVGYKLTGKPEALSKVIVLFITITINLLKTFIFLSIILAFKINGKWGRIL